MLSEDTLILDILHPEKNVRSEFDGENSDDSIDSEVTDDN